MGVNKYGILNGKGIPVIGKIAAFFVMTSIIYGSSSALAGEAMRFYSGIRPLGMGNAFITLSDDENALFYNPAGLNDIEGFHGFELLNPNAEISESSIEVATDLQDLDTESVVEVSNFLEGLVGEDQHVRVSVFPNLTFHNFSIGGVGVGNLDITVHSRQMPNVDTDASVNYGPVAGFAFGTYDSALQFGISGKYIIREGIKKTYTAVDIVNESFDPFDEMEEKKDFSLDAGLKYNMGVALKPSLAVVVQNITDLDFDTLGKIPQTINVGVGFHPVFWKIKSAFVLQFDDLTEEIESDLGKRLHAGVEFRLPIILAIRAGINQGWATFGADIDLWILKVRYATYSEELGQYAGQKENRRHVAQVSIGF